MHPVCHEISLGRKLLIIQSLRCRLMLKAHDTLFRVWELAVSFLGLLPLPLVPRENTESQANWNSNCRFALAVSIIKETAEPIGCM